MFQRPTLSVQAHSEETQMNRLVGCLILCALAPIQHAYSQPLHSDSVNPEYVDAPLGDSNDILRGLDIAVSICNDPLNNISLLETESAAPPPGFVCPTRD